MSEQLGRQKSKQNGTQATALQRPDTNDRNTWRAYWDAHGQPWRIEPEIDGDRQRFLAERRSITPDIKLCIYPFKDIKLSRADVEWLLATHDAGRGPVDWSDEQGRERSGLDMRGADLGHADLHQLPLTKLCGGLALDVYNSATLEQRKMAAVWMEEANLNGAQLEGADLIRAQLEGTYLNGAQLKGADLSVAQLEGAYLNGAQLKGTYLSDIKLVDKQRIGPRLVDAQWNGANLSVVDWSQVAKIGDEWEAEQKKTPNGEKKDKHTRLDNYRHAVRANRQLAVALQAQGLNEEASRFAYRAQKLQCIVMRLERKFGQYLFYLFLDLLAGYGYRPIRSLLWYIVIIFGFATAYITFGHLPPFPDALVFSLMSFHGRGFFPSLSSETNLHNPVVMFAAAEAVIGLFIEISFIATFTKRFYGS